MAGRLARERQPFGRLAVQHLEDGAALALPVRCDAHVRGRRTHGRRVPLERLERAREGLESRARNHGRTLHVCGVAARTAVVEAEARAEVTCAVGRSVGVARWIAVRLQFHAGSGARPAARDMRWRRDRTLAHARTGTTWGEI